MNRMAVESAENRPAVGVADDSYEAVADPVGVPGKVPA